MMEIKVNLLPGLGRSWQILFVCILVSVLRYLQPFTYYSYYFLFCFVPERENLWCYLILFIFFYRNNNSEKKIKNKKQGKFRNTSIWRVWFGQSFQGTIVSVFGNLPCLAVKKNKHRTDFVIFIIPQYYCI